MTLEIKVGATIDVGYPFVRESISLFGEAAIMTWRPGTRFEPVPPDDTRSFADAIGAMVLTIVSIHRPGKFPTRVFYTRRWRGPDGREFGKNNLHVRTLGYFKALCRGYRYDFEVKGAA